MGRPNTVSGLIEKRGQIAGQIKHLQAQLGQLLADLDAVDNTIRLFDPKADIPGIKARAYPLRHVAHRGEMSRMILTVLRFSGVMLTSLEIARSVMEARGMNLEDQRATVMMRKRVSATLWKLRQKGVARSGPLQAGEFIGWELSR